MTQQTLYKTLDPDTSWTDFLTSLLSVWYCPLLGFTVEYNLYHGSPSANIRGPSSSDTGFHKMAVDGLVDRGPPSVYHNLGGSQRQIVLRYR